MEISNALKLARRAKENNDSDNAKKYYEMILLEDPDNWEANFYTTYFDVMSVSIQTMPHKTTLLYNSIPSALKLVKETVKDKEEQVKVLDTMSCDIIEISTFYSNAVTNFQMQHSGSDTFYLQPNTIEFVCLFADTVYTLFADNEPTRALSVAVWKHAFNLVGAARFAVFEDKEGLLASLLAKIRVYEPDFYKKEEEEKRKEEEERRRQEEEKKRKEEERINKILDEAKAKFEQSTLLMSLLDNPLLNYDDCEEKVAQELGKSKEIEEIYSKFKAVEYVREVVGYLLACDRAIQFIKEYNEKQKRFKEEERRRQEEERKRKEEEEKRLRKEKEAEERKRKEEEEERLRKEKEAEERRRKEEEISKKYNEYKETFEQSKLLLALLDNPSLKYGDCKKMIAKELDTFDDVKVLVSCFYQIKNNVDVKEYITACEKGKEYISKYQDDQSKRKAKIKNIVTGAIAIAIAAAFLALIYFLIVKPYNDLISPPAPEYSNFDPSEYNPTESISITVSDKEDDYKSGEYCSTITFDLKNTGDGDFTYIVGNIEFYNGTELVASGQTYFTGSFDSNKTVSVSVEYSLGDSDGLYETSLENLEVIFKVTGIRFEGSDKLYEYNELSINISK